MALTSEQILTGVIVGGLGILVLSKVAKANGEKPQPTPKEQVPAFSGSFSISGPSVGYKVGRVSRVGQLAGVGAVRINDGRALDQATIRFTGSVHATGNQQSEGVFHLFAVHGASIGDAIREGTTQSVTLNPGDSRPVTLAVDVSGADSQGPLYGLVILTDPNLKTLQQQMSPQLGTIEGLAGLHFDGDFGVGNRAGLGGTRRRY